MSEWRIGRHEAALHLWLSWNLDLETRNYPFPIGLIKIKFCRFATIHVVILSVIFEALHLHTFIIRDKTQFSFPDRFPEQNAFMADGQMLLLPLNTRQEF